MSTTALGFKAMNKLVVIRDIWQGLICFLLLRLGFVLDYEIFLGMHPAILDTLDWEMRYIGSMKILSSRLSFTKFETNYHGKNVLA